MPTAKEPIESIQQLIKAGIAQINVGCFATVIDYDATTQSCSARPIVKAEILGGDPIALPTIRKVPVKWFSAGGFSLTCTLAPGDFVWLDFCDRDSDGWLILGKDPVNTGDRTRRFSLNDAVATPCGRPFVAPVRTPIDTFPARADTTVTVPNWAVGFSAGTVSITVTHPSQAPTNRECVIAQDDYTGKSTAEAPNACRIGPQGIRIGKDSNSDLLNILYDTLDALQRTASGVVGSVINSGTTYFDPTFQGSLKELMARLETIRRP